MKNNLQRLAIFTILLTAFVLATSAAALAQGDEENPHVVTFSKIKAEAYIHSENIQEQFRCGDSIYAQAVFADRVDVSEGWTVSILFNEELVLQEKMNHTRGGAMQQSVGVDLLPNENSPVDYPTATILYADKLLRELPPGVHPVQVAVSLGADNDVIAIGEFQFDTRRGCEAQFVRVNRRLQNDIARLKGQQQPKQPIKQQTEEPANAEEDTGRQQTSVEEQPQQPAAQPPPQPEPEKPAVDAEIEVYNNCGDSRYIKIEQPNGSSDNANLHGNYVYYRLPFGTKIFLVTDGNHELVDTVVSNPSNTSYGKQQIKLCR